MTLVRLVPVLLILVLGVFSLSLVIGIGSSATGVTEKAALIALVVVCTFLAAQVPKFATRARGRLSRR